MYLVVFACSTNLVTINEVLKNVHIPAYCDMLAAQRIARVPLCPKLMTGKRRKFKENQVHVISPDETPV